LQRQYCVLQRIGGLLSAHRDGQGGVLLPLVLLVAAVIVVLAVLGR
jgi:hypothetical protein